MHLLYILTIAASVLGFHTIQASAKETETVKLPVGKVFSEAQVEAFAAQELQRLCSLTTITYLINKPDSQRVSDDIAQLVFLVNQMYQKEKADLDKEFKAYQKKLGGLTEAQRKDEAIKAENRQLATKRKQLDDTMAENLVQLQREVATLRKQKNAEIAAQKKEADSLADLPRLRAQRHAKVLAPQASLAETPATQQPFNGMQFIQAGHNGFMHLGTVSSHSGSKKKN